MNAEKLCENGIGFTAMAEKMEDGAWKLPCGTYSFEA